MMPLQRLLMRWVWSSIPINNKNKPSDAVTPRPAVFQLLLLLLLLMLLLPPVVLQRLNKWKIGALPIGFPNAS
jgi:hypothetical protein